MRVATCSCDNSVCSCGGPAGLPKAANCSCGNSVCTCSVTATSKQAVYNGQPLNTFGPYTKWTQVHQRDLGETDYADILKAAKEWMKAPSVKMAEGEVKDTQLRAALDLAIRDLGEGRYSGAIQPTTYNMLLARLANTKDETGATVRSASEKSSYANESQGTPIVTTETTKTATKPEKLKKGSLLHTSKQIKTMATKVASKHPSLAFDLIDLADTVASHHHDPVPAKESGYDALREAVLKTASDSPAAQQVLASVLRLIKTQDEARQIRASQTSPGPRNKK